jgi:L-amino acid N-acyltransferase YncA
MTSDLTLRGATPDHLPGITAIFNEIIANSTAVYYFEPATLAERRAWFEDRQRAGYPVVVMTQGDDVLGFASFARVGAARPATTLPSSTRCMCAPTAGARGSAARWSRR